MDAVKAEPTATAALTNTGPPGRRAQADRRTLTFSSGALSPQAGLDERLASGLTEVRAAGRGFVYGFISLNVFLTETIRDELLRFDVTLLGPHDTMHKARLPADAVVLAEIVDLPHVEWIGFSTLEQKTSSDLGVPAPETAGLTGASTSLDIVVNLFDDDPAGDFRRAIEATGAAVGSWDPALRAYSVTASPAALDALIRLDFVLFVEPVRRTVPQHDQSIALIGADYIHDSAYDGAVPANIGVIDTGFKMNHLDFQGKDYCQRDFTGSSGGATVDRDGHGTHVLGTIAGTGTADSRYRGVAPGVFSLALAKALKWNPDTDKSEGGSGWLKAAMDWMAEGCPPPNRPGDPQGGRAVVVNFSLAVDEPFPTPQTVFVGTDDLSRKLDSLVWTHQQVYVVAAGNFGYERRQTITKPAVAKNALTVGNVRDNGHGRVGDRSGSSSIGVTGDLRMKPNLVAPGQEVTSTSNSSTGRGYTNKTGTSMAAPHVTGLVATLMDHYPHFVGRPALVRAYLMATSILHDDKTTPDRAGVSPRRDEYGLGRVSSYLAHWAREESGGWLATYGHGSASAGSYEYFDLTVPSDAQRVVVVTTWDEPAASAGAGKAVLYDYDLWIDHNADCSSGNCGEWASRSREDNVEYAIIDNPPAGTYRIKLHPVNGRPAGVPYGTTVFVNRGDPTPPMTLTATPSTASPAVGQQFTITTRVSTPSYVASGVHLTLTAPRVGTNHSHTNPIRPDGSIMDLRNENGALEALTIGNVVAGRDRRVEWKFTPTAAGRQTYAFRAWSENGGTRHATVTVDVGSLEPDLLVLSASAGDHTRSPEEEIALSVRVGNQGSGNSGFVHLDFYRSVDADISASDTLVHRVVLSSLGAGDARTVVVRLTSPSTAGTYFYGACAWDTTVAETRTDNNCSSGVRITVAGADLVVEPLRVDDNTLTVDQAFTLTATVRNQGTGAAGATTIRLYRAVSALYWNAPDNEVGNGSVPGLGASGTRSFTFHQQAPSTPGTYYYGACVGSVVEEATGNKLNNCSSAVEVTVTGSGFTDDPIVPGQTPVRTAHFMELRARIDALRSAHGVGGFPWTDATLETGVTAVRSVHMAELRTALREAYDLASRAVDFTTEALQPGAPIRAWHINELRRAVVTLER